MGPEGRARSLSQEGKNLSFRPSGKGLKRGLVARKVKSGRKALYYLASSGCSLGFLVALGIF